MSTTPWEDNEKRNYIFMDDIFTNVVTKELRKIFVREWNNCYQSKLGAWDDTSISGSQLFNLEKSRARPNKNTIQSKFNDGDTNKWDCSVLFDAILYSNSIGKSLNPIIRTEVDNLRGLRNEIKHISEGKLTDNDFQNMVTRVENVFQSLGLTIREIIQMKTNRSHCKSFQVLPPSPDHEVVLRSYKVREVTEVLERLRSDNTDKLTYFYISGNPGSGKSQLARQICENILNGVNWQAESVFVMTLDGRDVDSLLNSYEDFCRRLNCNESVLKGISADLSKTKEEKIKDLRSQMMVKLRNWKKWWIVIDNVENLKLISPLLPKMGDKVLKNGQVILTTQNSTSVPPDGLFCKHVSLSLGMNDHDCRQLLALLSKTDGEDSILDKVAERLDRQPLAMAAAAVYMRRVLDPDCCPDFSWLDYLEKLRKGKRKVTEEPLCQINSAYSSTMSAAVLLAVEKCQESSTILKHTFNLFSLISFEPLPRDLILKYILAQDNEFDAEDVFPAIKHCSLFIHVANKDRDIRLHRVVHEAVKVACHDNGRSIAKDVVRTMHYFEDREDKIKLIPHLKTFATEVKELFKDDALRTISLCFEPAEISLIYLFFGQILRLFSEFRLAMEFQNSNMRIWKNSEKDVDLSHIYNELGFLHNDLGDFDEARSCLQKALEIQLEQPGPNYINVASSYNNLGTVFSDKGDLESAEDYHQRALKIQLDQLGPNHIHVASSYNNLGTVCSDKGDMEKAEKYHQLALQIQLQQMEPTHIDIASSYNNLGTVFSDKGDLEKAEDYHTRALEIQLKHFGPNHIDVASSYNNLGTVFSDKGKLDKAVDYHKRALEIQLELLGQNHIDVASSYNNLGTVYSDKGDLETAKDYHERALQIQLEQLGPKHIDIASSLNNLGTVCSDNGELDEAQDFHQRALEIQLEQFGPNHVDIACSYNNLGTVCSDKGDLEAAKDYHERALKIQLEHLGSNHIDVADSYHNLGMVFAEKDELDLSLDCHKKALKIRIEQFGTSHDDVASSYGNLSVACMRKGETEKAKEYHQKARESKSELPGPNHSIGVASVDEQGSSCDSELSGNEDD